MLNFIRADLYRLSRSKSFWITEGIILLLVILSVVSKGSVGVTLGDSTQTAGSLTEMTGFLAIQTSLSSMLLYYSLPLVMQVLGSEYTKGTMKNIITVGVSKPAYLFGKFLVYALVLVLQIVAICVVSFVAGTVIGGIGYNDLSQIENLLYYFVSFVLILLATSSFAVLVLYLTKNTAVSVLATIFIPMAFAIARISLPNWKFLEYLDFQGGLEMVTMTTFQTWKTVQPIFLGSLISLLLCLLAAHLVFKRQEL
ncbi:MULTISPECIES: ABC transporter permease [Enterococcus]|uniref:ABC-2 family transporter protein n=1 Tax=Enterococcus innesii TaxID=2839759 RepID=A0ABN6NQZ7_9ENTE|nr:MULTISPECIES: ABC transporter permease [Enterococcus]MBK0037648.1 ABC transporter permease [Enterococcus sp. S52]MBK0070227.1 ABC transporter permease [Enterococcus sp. S53]MBK0141067.1 ABC transporter permease [Enterococcus sp. S76]MBK0144455.1 ABC transporter permease [Enterococcus sp. S77]BDG68647.1 ABC-2 family transporter protein [Enterococcus innesii]